MVEFKGELPPGALRSSPSLIVSEIKAFDDLQCYEWYMAYIAREIGIKTGGETRDKADRGIDRGMGMKY